MKCEKRPVSCFRTLVVCQAIINATFDERNQSNPRVLLFNKLTATIKICLNAKSAFLPRKTPSRGTYFFPSFFLPARMLFTQEKTLHLRPPPQKDLYEAPARHEVTQ